MDSPVRDDFVADILLKHPDTRDGVTHLVIPRGLPRGYSFVIWCLEFDNSIDLQPTVISIKKIKGIA